MINDIINIAKKAGKTILATEKKEHHKRAKHDVGSIVTDADYASEKIILEELSTLFPTHNLQSEEKGMQSKESNYTWHIDPLDGTSNYARNNPLYGISIGLAKNKEPILGVLYFPKLDLLVYAEKGKGAYVKKENNQKEEKIRVSKRRLLEALYYAGGYYKEKLYLRPAITSSVAYTKMFDASAYEFAQIALGNAEIYELTSSNHDVVAGTCIVREAGGKVTDYEGNNWTTDSKTIIATNGIVHKEVLAIIKGEQK